MKVLLKKRFLIPLLLLGFYGFGPRQSYAPIEGKIEPLKLPLEQIDQYIQNKESKIKNLKPQNKMQLLWADSIRKTPWSVVYLHGFSASQMEGDPIHREFAKRYGCNLLLTRLKDHGIEDREVFKNITPQDWIDSAREAIALAKLVGHKVLVMSCSTGGTLSAYLSAHNPELIDAQIFFSPNFELDVAGTELMVMPWGKQILRWMTGGNYRKTSLPENCHPYWTSEYHIDGLIALRALLDATVRESFAQKIDSPLFIGYYYKDENNYDGVVSIPAMHQYFEWVDTPESKKEIQAFPEVGSHIMASWLQSQDLESVRKKTYQFAEEVLGFLPIQS